MILFLEKRIWRIRK